MNLSTMLNTRSVILDALWSCDIPDDAIVARVAPASYNFSECHLDFETNTHEFWITIRLDGSVKVYRHSKGVYNREQYTLRSGVEDTRLSTKYLVEMIRGLVDGSLQPIAKQEKS